MRNMSKFQFDEKRHRYTFDGKPMTGVTTILGVIAKPALINWAANMAADYVKDNLTDIEELEKVCKEARKAHVRTRDKAADKGTNVHEEVEKIVNDAIENGGKLIHTTHESKQVQKFLDWAHENDVTFLASEFRVYSEKHWYAGTADLLFEMEGRKYIGDVKTGKAVYPSYFFQMAAYRLAHEEMTGDSDIDGAMVIRLGKDGSFETRERFDYEEDKKAFLAALQLYKTLNTYEI